MKPLLYCVMIDYANGVAYSDIEFLNKKIARKERDGDIEYIGNDSFLFRRKDRIEQVLGEIYREFGHFKEFVDQVSLLHVSHIEHADMNVLLDKSNLH